MSMQKLVIKAVGSSMFIAEEIKAICQSLLGNAIQIDCVISSSVARSSSNEFYVCANTQKRLLENHISEGQLFDMELKPTTAFFLDLAKIPKDETVHVFNNLSPYIDMLTSEFSQISPHTLKFIPIPYAEMNKDDVRHLLSTAHYIIGVDCFMGEKVLLSDDYKDVLLPDVKLIAGHRTASLNSSYRLLRGVAAYYLSWGESILSDKQEESLTDVYKTLQEIINLIQSGAMKALFNQIGSYDEDHAKNENIYNDDKTNLIQQIKNQLKMISFLQERVGMVTLK